LSKIFIRSDETEPINRRGRYLPNMLRTGQGFVPELRRSDSAQQDESWEM